MEYTPSIAGYLINKELKMNDVLADILNLYAMKIIDIKKDKDSKYIINFGEKYNENKSKLSSSNRYLLDRILATKIEFNFLEWREKILNDYVNVGLYQPMKLITTKTYCKIICFIIIFGMIIAKILWNSILQGIILSVVLYALFTIIIYHITALSVKTKTKLSKKGKEELKKCIKLKRFMEEYTLLEDRKVEEIMLYEQYIPYAIALGVNKKCSGTIYEFFEKETIQEISEDIFFTI